MNVVINWGGRMMFSHCFVLQGVEHLFYIYVSIRERSQNIKMKGLCYCLIGLLFRLATKLCVSITPLRILTFL